MKWLISVILLLALPGVGAFMIHGCNATPVSISTVDDFAGNEAHLNCFLANEGGLDLWYLRSFVGSRHTEIVTGDYRVELLMDRGRLDGITTEKRYPRARVECPPELLDSCIAQGKDPREWTFVTQTKECDVQALRATAVPSVTAFNVMRSMLISLEELKKERDFTANDLLRAFDSATTLLFAGHYAIWVFFDTFVGVYR